MRTTGIFTIHNYRISFKKYNEPIYLIPFGDVHRSAPLCHTEKWLEFLEWAKKKNRCYFLGMGDYDDLASTSERMNLSKKNFHESTVQTLEQLYEDHTNRLYKEIKFMEGKLIGLVEGNHYAEFSSGITTTQLLAQKLKAKYLGVSSFIRLTFEYGGSKNRVHSVDLFVHHGKGSGKRMGSSLNTVEDMIRIADADIYLMGHDHKKSCGYLTKLRLTPGGGQITLHNRKIMMGRTGSFLKGYVPEEPSYVADANYNPSDLGVLKIELTPRRIQENNKDSFYVDIHTSI